MEKAGNEDPRVHLVRNACNYEHFAMRRDPPPDFKPAINLASMPHPLIGYMGDIAEWFDQDLVAFLARSRPAWNFVFFGPLQHDLSKLTRFTNLHFPGRVPYADLPLYLHHFDCLLIPFVLSDLTMEVNPVKMYEYLATGKPVVSSAMPEVVRHEDVVGIGRSPEDFLAKIDAALAGDSEEKAEARRAVARANSWTERVERTASIIADALANK
jgi:glycosyltransferase involved in cell wall biosynthesis